MSDPCPSDRTVWAVNPYSWRAAEGLAAGLGVPLVAATVLAGRGLTDLEAARRFLACDMPLPDPFLFGGMEGAVETISRAIDEGRRIVVHGDYDADGITATTIMVLGLRELGLTAEWYLPSRFKEGYGLSRQAVDLIAAGGPAALVTVDCGVNYPDEVAYAQDLGLEVVVIDHHRPGPKLPECHLIHEVVGDYPHGDLCGVGLALKVLHALHIRREGARRDTLPERLHELLDLVAVGTIADLASLQGENRYYVKEGLKLIAIGRRTGLRALCTVAGCTGAVDSGAVAYRLAPRLNAAGRLADPSPPLRLLLTDDEDEAAALAAELHELNGARQDVERQILEEALRRVEDLAELPPALVLAGNEWHEGVVGIVASRLVERYHRPTILLGVRDGVAKGSGRSIAAYDLMGGLNACADHLTVYGGHRQAVGLTLEAGQVDEFSRAIEAHARGLLDAGDFSPVYRADAVLRGEDVNADTATALAALGPFGSGNPRPRLLLVGADIQQAEATRNGSHLRCTVSVDGVKTRGIGFGMGPRACSLREAPGPRVLGVELRVDEWQGTLRPEFLLERVGPAAGCGDRSPETVAGCGYVKPVRPEPEDSGDGWASGDGDGPALSPAGSRDVRDSRGAASAMAQVLASGERVMLIACSAPQAWSLLEERLALGEMWGGRFGCAGRGSGREELGRLAEVRIALVEWDSSGRAYEAAGPWDHVVATGPPFRAGHLAVLRRAEAEGCSVHLCYGEDERRETARLLRYLVHPRFAMVCLYRAMQEGGRTQARLFTRAAEIGWQEARVVLTWADCERAALILDALGAERLDPGEAKLEARSIPAYVAAEADYEECSRLCLTL
jgi:single-stranded-DNA-specific exonuclease